ncbi:MAG TPA: hypothetical protein GXZ82_07510 [Firmicutes bacterium]|jgi:hypothetical protein|nr:hypothetical protein [Bacillota bacterium]
MFLQKWVVITLVVCLFTFTSVAGAETVLFFEDFSSDAIGDFPSSFGREGFLWGDVSPVFQVLDGLEGNDGKALVVLGQELGSQGYLTSPTMNLAKSDFVIEFDIFVPGESENKYDAGFYVFANDPFVWPPFINIYVGNGRLTVVEGSKETTAGDVTMGQWNHITLRSNLADSTTIVSINDQALERPYAFRTVIDANTPKIYLAIFWRRDNRPDTYWDNFKVWQ